MHVLRNIIIPGAFCCIFATFGDIWKKVRVFSRKIQLFLEKNEFWTFLELLHFQSLSTANFLFSAIFTKCGILYEVPMYFFENKPIFERFEKFYSFRRVLRQICYLERLKNIYIFFKNTSFFQKKEMSMFWEI